MISELQINEIIKDQLTADDVFIVELAVKPGNQIVLSLDKMTGVSIDYCAQISKLIEGHFDREVEDFELEVSSAGIGQPFKVYKQYLKNLDNEVELLLRDGKKLKGTLIEVTPEGFSVRVENMVKPEGKKRKELQVVDHPFKFEDVKSVKDIVVF